MNKPPKPIERPEAEDREGDADASDIGWKSDRLGVEIPMRDGRKLAADVLLPPAAGRFPTIYIHTPYNRRYGGAPLPDELLATGLQDREHFAYVVVDWRGFFGSKDAAVGVPEPNHGADGYDVIQWIARQPWSNGKVGMWGVSAVGAVQCRIAMEQPPQLVCAVPASANFGFPYEQFYYGGVLQRYYVNVMELVGHEARDLVLDSPTPDARLWRIAAAKFDGSRIDLPLLFVTGWYDTHPDLKIETFSELRSGNKKHARDMKLIIGPWLHTKIGERAQGALEFPAAEGVLERETLRFFNYWLRGVDDGDWQSEPAIRYFQMGSNLWRSARKWPPPTTAVRYYLRAGNLLRREEPGAERPDSYRYDPADPTPTVGGNLIEVRGARLKVPVGPQDLRQRVESRADVVTYTSDPLAEDLEVVGAVEVHLHVSSDREDTDFAVRLSDVHPDGRSILVTDGIQRMLYRRSFDGNDWMKPGEVYEVTVRLPATAQTFVRGHRIRISVSSSNWPRFEPNPNIRRKRLLGPNRLVATNRVYHERGRTSFVALPVYVQNRQ